MSPPDSRRQITSAGALLMAAIESAAQAVADAAIDLDRGDNPDTALRRLKIATDHALRLHAQSFKEGNR